MKTPPVARTPTEVYSSIVAAFADASGVTVGAGSKKGFGASALSVGGKIFAMLSSRDHFVVKLPKARVDKLVASGVGQRFGPGNGRRMKEWIEVGPGREAAWLGLAEEARAFGAEKSKKASA